MSIRRYRPTGIRRRFGVGGMHAQIGRLHRARMAGMRMPGMGRPVAVGAGMTAGAAGLGTMYGLPHDNLPVNPSNTSGRPVVAAGSRQTGDEGESPELQGTGDATGGGDETA
jgi:hypothetical protein